MFIKKYTQEIISRIVSAQHVKIWKYMDISKVWNLKALNKLKTLTYTISSRSTRRELLLQQDLAGVLLNEEEHESLSVSVNELIRQIVTVSINSFNLYDLCHQRVDIIDGFLVARLFECWLVSVTVDWHFDVGRGQTLRIGFIEHFDLELELKEIFVLICLLEH